MNDINEVLLLYEDGYKLTELGYIQVQNEDGLDELIDASLDITTSNPSNIDEKILYAIKKFSKWDAKDADKKEAIRILADVMEYLKKDGITLDKRDDSNLFNIFNNFSIRHHNKNQNGEYDAEIWYPWIFFTTLNSVRQLSVLKKNGYFDVPS